ncbi:MAG: hypothetical protein CYPHOPRED_005285 [Cyphobasidiales sp. Tagirdzhanova-0007]|nr:MAG: hypothetical protein CYPHOPRED_005285 [Cyphobasidiales sp. Tagirdzhanova-0007]
MSWKRDVQAYLHKGKAAEVPASPSEPAGNPDDLAQVHDGILPKAASVGTSKLGLQQTPNTLAVPLTTSALSNFTQSKSSAPLSRSPSASSGITKYKERLRSAIQTGQFEIENATALPLNISLNHGRSMLAFCKIA